jgi:hypothetical protein
MWRGERKKYQNDLLQFVSLAGRQVVTVIVTVFSVVPKSKTSRIFPLVTLRHPLRTSVMCCSIAVPGFILACANTVALVILAFWMLNVAPKKLAKYILKVQASATKEEKLHEGDTPPTAPERNARMKTKAFGLPLKHLFSTKIVQSPTTFPSVRNTGRDYRMFTDFLCAVRDGNPTPEAWREELDTIAYAWLSGMDEQNRIYYENELCGVLHSYDLGANDRHEMRLRRLREIQGHFCDNFGLVLSKAAPVVSATVAPAPSQCAEPSCNTNDKVRDPIYPGRLHCNPANQHK